MIKRIKSVSKYYLKVLISKLKFLMFKHIPIQKGITDENREKNITISITSYPKRLDTIYITIKSLMHQSMKANRIILYLGSDSIGYKLNHELIELTKKGLEIKYLDENIKSHKKYYYSMLEFPDDLIITVDDDLIYDNNFILNLYKSYLNNPNCVHAYRVHKYTQHNKKILPYSNWEFECNSIKTPTNKLFLTTGAGTLFPANILPSECFDKENIINLCLNADDVWINFFLLKNKIKIKWVYTKKQMPTVIYSSQKTNLFEENLENGGNDTYIKQLSEFYNIDLYKSIFEEN